MTKRIRTPACLLDRLNHDPTRRRGEFLATLARIRQGNPVGDVRGREGLSKIIYRVIASHPMPSCVAVRDLGRREALAKLELLEAETKKPRAKRRKLGRKKPR